MSETTAHEALAAFLRYHAAPRLPDLAYVWHTPNESAGGAKAASGVPLDVLKEARMGAVSGVWDWLFIGPNVGRIGESGPYFFQGCALELKSTAAFRKRDQGLSPEQVAWRARYIRCGWYTAVYPEQDWPDAARLLVRWVGGDVADFDFGGR
jgi:hypothetical protein